VSGRSQRQRHNLENQRDGLREEVERRGGIVIAKFREVVSGWDSDRPVLAAAIEKAKESGAILLAESADRFIRSKDFHTRKNPGALPSVAEFEELKRITAGVVLCTLLPPDTPWRQVRGHQSRRGQRAKARKGGRPPERKWGERRLARIDLARKMRDEGLSYQQIADSLNARDDGFTDQTPMTIFNWLRRGV
jgi:DNA invertase Pin-like site-specific DNA recombinase